jgi:A/G-specific adenine glycosylase
MTHIRTQQNTPPATFSQRLLSWFDHYGRTDLPWQQNSTPYRVWVSEIMLQQTQVNTVIPYYQRFLQRFPEVSTLATAALDEVLHSWTGLGYYARARNLHRAAQLIHVEYADVLPKYLDGLMQLPGIGRSTAGAILALADGQRCPILDGNVKRVLCRYYAIDGWPGESQVEHKLWQLAEQLTPTGRVSQYTQAIMDLGATVCTRRRPSCHSCPFTNDCWAQQSGQVMAYPVTKPRKALPIKQTLFIMLQNQWGEVLLEQRPSQGIWGGLWSFPECATLLDMRQWCSQYLDITVLTYDIWQSIRHTFTHFHLDITPIYIPIQLDTYETVAISKTLWYNMNNPQTCGLAAPVVSLLTQLTLPKTGELLL